jgi:hypothetical protein
VYSQVSISTPLNGRIIFLRDAAFRLNAHLKLRSAWFKYAQRDAAILDRRQHSALVVAVRRSGKDGW